jgi:hypothetical protein
MMMHLSAEYILNTRTLTSGGSNIRLDESGAASWTDDMRVSDGTTGDHSNKRALANEREDLVIEGSASPQTCRMPSQTKRK